MNLLSHKGLLKTYCEIYGKAKRGGDRTKEQSSEMEHGWNVEKTAEKLGEQKVRFK